MSDGRVHPKISLQLRCAATKAWAWLPPTQKGKCPRTPRMEGASPLREWLVAASRVQGVCGTIRTAGCGRPTPWPEIVMSNTVQAYKRRVEVRNMHSSMFYLEAPGDLADAGAPGVSRFTGIARSAAPCASHGGRTAHGSDSGSLFIDGLHGQGRTSGTTARQPGRFAYADGVTAFRLSFPAGVRVRGGSAAGHATRALPSTTPRGGYGWRTG